MKRPLALLTMLVHGHGSQAFSALRNSVVVLIFLPIMLPVALQAQTIEWGKIPREHLEMKTFPDDTNATAIILADIGEVKFNRDFRMEYTRHRRIKILTEAGYDWGDVHVAFYKDDGLQKLSKGDIEGQTFLLRPDGSVKRTKLEGKSVHEEDVDGKTHRMRFTLPALSPGCVIEYKFKIVSKHGAFLEDWTFQSDEPTLWSEFRAEIPQFYHYVMWYQGINQFDVQNNETYPWPPTLTQPYQFKCTKFFWAMRDVPALRSEPFLTSLEDHRQKVSFQLAKVIFPGQSPREFLKTWDTVAEELNEDDSFGKQIERHKVLRQQAQKLVAGINSSEEKIRAIYNYVKSTMVWDGEQSVSCEKDLDDAFEAKRGNTAEIALMLTGMLRAAGVEAHPVLLRTREKGHLIRRYPIVTQFNYVLTYANTDGKEYLLDATDPLRPMHLLPEEVLNTAGWVVVKGERFVPVPLNSGEFFNKTEVSAKLAKDGSIAGVFESVDDGYSALFDRHTLQDKSEEDYIQDGWLEDLTGAQLDSFRIQNQDSSDTALLTEAHFSSFDHTQLIGDSLIYFQPVFFGRRESNPFKSPVRRYPVDFAYPRRFIYTLNLEIPPGYTAELPEPEIQRLSNNSGQFLYLVESNDRLIRLSTALEITRTKFDTAEYRQLRDFYDNIVQWHSKPIVLKK